MHVRSEISIGERSETSSLLACRKGWLSLRTAAVDWPRLTALVSALPGLRFRRCEDFAEQGEDFRDAEGLLQQGGDRKSTRLNSSHGYISYAVFCLKKKKKI